jgi:hypothetical protein
MTTFACPHCSQLIEVHQRNVGQPVLTTDTPTPTDLIQRICATWRVEVAAIIRPGKTSKCQRLIRYEIIRELHRAYPHAGDVAIARWTRVDRSTVWAVLHAEGGE